MIEGSHGENGKNYLSPLISNRIAHDLLRTLELSVNASIWSNHTETFIFNQIKVNHTKAKIIQVG